MNRISGCYRVTSAIYFSIPKMWQTRCTFSIVFVWERALKCKYSWNANMTQLKLCLPSIKKHYPKVMENWATVFEIRVLLTSHHSVNVNGIASVVGSSPWSIDDFLRGTFSVFRRFQKISTFPKKNFRGYTTNFRRFRRKFRRLRFFFKTYEIFRKQRKISKSPKFFGNAEKIFRNDEKFRKRRNFSVA